MFKPFKTFNRFAPFKPFKSPPVPHAQDARVSFSALIPAHFILLLRENFF